MRDSNQSNETQSARGTLLVVAGILATVVAAIGGVRAADGMSGPDDVRTANSTHAPSADDSGAGGGQSDGMGVAGDDDEGSLEPVRTKPAELRDPVGFQERARFGIGLNTRVVDVQAVQGEARGPGEISGPALRVTVRAANTSSHRIPLDNMFVDMSYGEQRTPAVMLSDPGAEPFPASIAAGDVADGTYVFTVPPEERDRVQVTVTYSAEVPTAVFSGPVR